MYRDICGKCGAQRIDNQLGLEATPEEYVANMVAVFREVWRVLRDDGTCWLNLGDSYAGSGGPGSQYDNKSAGKYKDEFRKYENPNKSIATLKPKDLVGIPWRVALALQADGWYLRSEITWCKIAPMPESVNDRPTNATEKIFLFSKNRKYYFDAHSVRTTHNIWNYWLIGPEPFSEAHFAVFPSEIPRKAIMMGSSQKGQCPVCGAPWERVVEKKMPELRRTKANGPIGGHGLLGDNRFDDPIKYTTTGWRPTCDHDAEPVPQIVLDPFSGAGTTGVVATKLNRLYVGLDLSMEYCKLAQKRMGKGMQTELPWASI